jgi:hypothetical protein
MIKITFFVNILFCITAIQAKTINKNSNKGFCSKEIVSPNIISDKEKLEEGHTDNSKHPIYSLDNDDARKKMFDVLIKIYDFDRTISTINELISGGSVAVCLDNKPAVPLSFFKTKEIKDSIFKISKLAFEASKGHTLIILGQTPAYLGVMIKKINEINGNKTKIVNIPFSGYPNCKKNLLAFPRYRKKERSKDPNFNVLSDESKHFFYDLLETKYDLSPEKIVNHSKKLFILDNSSGPTIASFLSLLKERFDKVNITMPSITFLCMRKGKDNHFFGLVSETGMRVEPELNKLDFSFIDNLNVDIETIFLGMEDSVLVELDIVGDNLRIVPFFNSNNWNKKYLKDVFHKYPTFEAKKIMKEYEEYAQKKY